MTCTTGLALQLTLPHPTFLRHIPTGVSFANPNSVINIYQSMNHPSTNSGIPFKCLSCARETSSSNNKPSRNAVSNPDRPHPPQFKVLCDVHEVYSPKPNAYLTRNIAGRNWVELPGWFTPHYLILRGDVQFEQAKSIWNSNVTAE